MATAIAEPWSHSAMGACVPVSAGLTQKVTGFIRGSSRVGTAGVGWIIMFPCLANDYPFIFHSNELYAQTDVNPLQGDDTLRVGVTRVPMANLPYPAAQFVGDGVRSNVAGRVVSASMRVWYTGTTLQQSGSIMSFRHPEHQSVQYFDVEEVKSPMNSDNLGQHRDTVIETYDRRKRDATDFAESEAELEIRDIFESPATPLIRSTLALYPYSQGAQSFFDGAVYSTYTTTGIANVGVPTSILFIQGFPGSSFSYEVIMHAEYNGLRTAAHATPTPSDAEGSRRVMSAAAGVATRKQAAPCSNTTALLRGIAAEEKAATKFAVKVERGVQDAAEILGV